MKVSEGKFQFVESEVRHLGHIIGNGYQKLSAEHSQGPISLPPPKPKKDVRKLLGLICYCKLWLEGYTKLVKFEYDKLVDSEHLNLTLEDDK